MSFRERRNKNKISSVKYVGFTEHLEPVYWTTDHGVEHLEALIFPTRTLAMTETGPYLFKVQITVKMKEIPRRASKT